MIKPRTPPGVLELLPRDQIAEMAPLGRSVMPEGLLDGLGDQELRDLFAYLRSAQPFLAE